MTNSNNADARAILLLLLLLLENVCAREQAVADETEDVNQCRAWLSLEAHDGELS